MTFKVAYVLGRFPIVSQTFISDEIFLLTKRDDIEVSIFSLMRPKDIEHHGRAKEILDAIDVNYLQQPGKFTKARLLLKKLFLHPIKTVMQLRAFSRLGQEKWLNFEALAYAEMIQSIGADHIHSHFADKAARTSAAISIWTGIPFTFTTHGYDIFFKPPANYIQLAERAKYIFAISRFNKNYLVEKLCLPAEKVKVVYCGIILDDYKSIAAKSQNPADSISLLTVARLHPVKGHRYLFHALKILRERTGSKYQLYLAGDGSELVALEELAIELGLAEDIHFLGNQNQSQICELLQECDYFVLPSISEGLPIVLQEAMASSRPVVAPDVNGVPELVIDRVTGFLFEPENADSLASAIDRAIRDTDGRQAMIAAARSKVVGEFSKEVSLDQLIRYWRE